MSLLIEPVVSFVVESLGKWLIEEANFGMQGQALEIQTELRRMRCFLVDTAEHSAGGRGRSFHNWVREVQEIAYDAEDAIENYVLRVASRRRTSSGSWDWGGIKIFVKRYSCVFHELMLRRYVGLGLKDVKSRICEVRESSPTYGVRALTEHEALSMTRRQRQGTLWRQTYAHDDQRDFVGLHQDVEKLVAILKDDHHSTVCLCGMGGLGKTTLAKKIYSHWNVKRGFYCFAWTCISQQFHREDVLKAILLELVPDRRDEIKDMIENEIVKQVHQVLRNERCFVVVDDIWTSKDWDLLKPAFPIDDMGSSKILLTTRNMASLSHVDPNGYFHPLRFLDGDEAWELLQKKAFPKRDRTNHKDDSIVELGRKMVKHCGGLPLGLIVLGGILATKHTVSEWEEVHRNIKSLISRGRGMGLENRGVSHVLELSYTELPHRLKPCFLCLGNFPEDSEIEAEELYHIWVAEGMVLKGRRRNNDGGGRALHG